MAISRLKTWLGDTGLREKNFPLYQLLNALIDAQRESEQVAAIVDGGGSGGGSIVNATYLTTANELALFPSSRRLLAGSGITFTDGPGTRTIDAAGSSGDQVKFDSVDIDFGATLCDYAEVVVTGITGIASQAKTFAWFEAATTVDSDEEDHIQAAINIILATSDIVIGDGFTIRAFVTQGLTKGLYTVQYLWSNG